jgi:hypothetical protein
MAIRPILATRCPVGYIVVAVLVCSVLKDEEERRVNVARAPSGHPVGRWEGSLGGVDAGGAQYGGAKGCPSSLGDEEGSGFDFERGERAHTEGLELRWTLCYLLGLSLNNFSF